MKVDLQQHYAAILTSTEQRGELMLLRQETGGADRGGFRTHNEGLVPPASGPGSLLTLIPLLVEETSRFAGSNELARGILLALEFSHRVQRPDGTFDLLPSNFFSAPDGAFIMHNLIRSYRILKAGNTAHPEIERSLYELILNTGRGLVGGGFHTPNHRWVIAAALAMAHNVTGEADFLTEAKRYLAEGIDVDDNGEFTERSSGIYNTVNDNALIILAEELEDPSYLDPVVKNLDMMFSYLEPDGALFTWNSTRQDKGEGSVGGRFFPARYYPLYLAMLTRKFDPRYAWIADAIFRQTPDAVPGALYRFLLDPALKTGLFESKEPSTSFDHFYEASRIARIRRGGISATVLAGSSSFLFVQTGSIRCRVKLCASFFAVAQFQGAGLEKEKGVYRMRFETHADYRLPLDPPPKTSDWAEMDHSRRVHVKEQALVFLVTVREVPGGVELGIKSEGCDRVPVKLEFILSPGTTITGDHFALPGKAGSSITVREGSISATTARDSLHLGPAFGEHWFTEAMRGSEPQSPDEFTVYFTGFTPVERNITITEDHA